MGDVLYGVLLAIGVIVGLFLYPGIPMIMEYRAERKHHEEAERKKSVNEKFEKNLTREERWLAQEKIDKMVLDRGDAFAEQMLAAIDTVHNLWYAFEYFDKENKQAELKSELYMNAITPELFLKNYYLFKAGNHDDIKDSIYTERPYLVLETIIKMGLFIFETKNNLYVLKKIINEDKEEYFYFKGLARRILNEELN